MKSFIATFVTGTKYLWSNPVNVATIAFFPIVLILLLGNALSSYISPETDFEPVSIAYVTDNENSAFNEFLKSEEIKKFINTEIYSENEAQNLLSENKAVLIVTENKGKISVTKSNSNVTSASIAISVIDTYIKISAATEAAIENGANPQEVMAKMSDDFTVSAMPLGNRVPTATDYYAVTMLVYIMLLAGLNGVELYGKNLLNDMGGRIMTAPVSKPVLVGGLITASTITSFLQGMVTFVFTAVFYGVYWGERIPLVLLTLFAIVLMSQAMAIFLILIFKNSGPAIGIMQAVFWASTFVSKGYAKVSFGEAADKIFAYAPNALAHTTIFGAIYGGNEDKMMQGLIIIFAVAAVFFVGAFIMGRRRFA